MEKQKCEEKLAMEYDDGNTTIYLYTKGRIGNHRKALSDMLKYIETSTIENAVNEPLKEFAPEYDMEGILEKLNKI